METNKRGGLVHEDGGVRGEYVMPGVSRTTAGSIQAVSACDAYWRPSMDFNSASMSSWGGNRGIRACFAWHARLRIWHRAGGLPSWALQVISEV